MPPRSHSGQTFIIEHPTRGVLREFVSAEEFRFSWSGQRGDPDTCDVFFSFEEAKRVLARLPARLTVACEIRVSPDWRVVA